MATLEHNFTPIIRQILERTKNYQAPLKQFYVYLQSQTAQMFPKLGRKGSGTFRQVSWNWFAAQYTRKDGLTVPAYGIPGKVLGKLRPSGKRVTERAQILSDTGRLRQAVLGKFNISTHQLIADTPVDYAETQHKRRPFMFVTDDDVDRLRKIIIDYLVG